MVVVQDGVGVSVSVRHQYNLHQGRLRLRLTASSPHSFANFAIQPVSQLRCRHTATNRVIDAKSPLDILIDIEAVQPFLAPPQVQFECNRSGVKTAPVVLYLPCVITKFLVPTTLSVQQFQQYWGQLAKPNQEVKLVLGDVKFKDPTAMLENGLQLGLVQATRTNTGVRFMLSAVFHTCFVNPQVPGKHVSVPVMVWLDTNNNQAKLAVRSLNYQVALGVCNQINAQLTQNVAAAIQH
eukprot:Platyproteum_vivax@DN4221_c0_g1_i2.p1